MLAYLRPLSDDADVLVAGSMTASGIEGSSLATAFRRNLLKGDPQQLALAVHQLSFADALPVPTREASLNQAQGVVLSYANTRRVSGSLTVTTGFEIDYLNSARDAMAARPRAEIEYHVSRSTDVAFRYGSARSKTALTTLKIAVFAPIPKARVMRAIAVKVGVLARLRRA